MSLKPRKDLPNRINDLRYKDWIKFQKSFFWHNSFNSTLIDFVLFFTKECYENIKANILVIDITKESEYSIVSESLIDCDLGQRVVDFYSVKSKKLLSITFYKKFKNKEYDYIFINAVGLKKNEVVENISNSFEIWKSILKQEKYITYLASCDNLTSHSFPTPWLISESGRGYFKLTDEKIGLIKNTNKHYYAINFQNGKEDVFRNKQDLINYEITKSKIKVPLTIFPKTPPRKKYEIQHPAKFPESLAEHFIKIFTKKNQLVFDPMVGMGSSVISALRLKRNGFGSDLSDEFIEIAKKRMISNVPSHIRKKLNASFENQLFACNALNLQENEIFQSLNINYCITSPPYWSVLNNYGSKYQKLRTVKELPLWYSNSENDIGNERDYERFINLLIKIFSNIYNNLTVNGHITIIVKNVIKDQTVYPLAWDLVSALTSDQLKFKYIGYTLWCQDNISLRPFALGTRWVSFTAHNYCLHFMK